ncbi:universal stress protein [Actinokineospora sp. NPDC004072]
MTGNSKRIVVGFDGSPSSVAALRWALAEGRALAATVTAVEVCPPDTAFLPATSMSLHPRGTVPHPGAGPLARIAEQVADEAGARLRVRRVSGRTGKALAETAEGADLIVIGAHHHAARLTTGMGVFAMDCVRHARCPVAVIPERT